MNCLQVKLLHNDAILPIRATPGAAGYDIASVIDIAVPSRGQALVSTGLSFSLPEGVYGRIAPRSGLSWKQHCTVGAGVIDPDYRGEVKVLIQNLSENIIKLSKGERIAQLILERYEACPVCLVDQTSETNRGEGGFGSTGKTSIG